MKIKSPVPEATVSNTISVRSIVFAFYLVPEFTMLALSSAIEALRLANRTVGYKAYGWRLVSESGGAVRANCGLLIQTDGCVATERRLVLGRERPSMVIVCAQDSVEAHSCKPLEAWLRECRNQRCAVGALGTGAYVLAKAGILNNRHCSIHWEKLPSFAEQFTDTIPSASIGEIEMDVWTCAGGSSSFDMMLHLIERDFDDATVIGICEYALVERIRAPGERQRIPMSSRHGMLNKNVIKVVDEMQKHLAEPCPIDNLAALVDLSRRQLERLFRRELNTSPVHYYRRLRLERATLLLTQTTMAIVDIAVACGFVSASHFSKCYREVNGKAPQESRGGRDRSQMPATTELTHKVVGIASGQQLEKAA